MNRKKARTSARMLSRGKELRRETTFPERLLWSRLRERLCHGLRFRRQHPVGKYVVDFYCNSAKAVVELDGVSHLDHVTEDMERELFLEGLGLRVIRVTNDEVLTNLDNVVEDIARMCGVDDTPTRPD